MSTRSVVKYVVLGVAGLVLLAVVAVLVVVQTAWFREYVRKTIVSSVEDSVGGRVEVGAFRFDVGSLHATVDRFVIHGKEPAGGPPFVSVERVELYLRLFSSLKRLYEISHLGVTRPEVSVITLADGSTNIPTPRQKGTSDKSALETVVDLAVGSFRVERGLLAFASTQQALDVRGRNLRALLNYNFAAGTYSGELGLEPLYILNGRNTPVEFRVSLPVTLGSDRIEISKGSIFTPDSQLAVNAVLEDMKHPKVSGTVAGQVSLRDVANGGNLPVTKSADKLALNLSGVASETDVNIRELRVGLGNSSVRASGPLRDPQGNGSLAVNASLVVDELARYFQVPSQPSGTVTFSGTARLDAANNYVADGNVAVVNMTARQGRQRLPLVNATSVLHADNHTIVLRDLRLHALGGELLADLELADLERYTVTGQLRNLSIQTAAAAFGQELPYRGSISGPLRAEGNLKTRNAGLTGYAHLAIAPGRGGIPVSGRLNAAYDGMHDSLAIDNSYVALPHSRVALAGALNQRLDLTFTSTDLADVLAVAKQPVPLKLNPSGGELRVAATVTGQLSAPRVAGGLAATRFVVQGRQFDSLRTTFAATPQEASVADGTLTRGTMTATFSGSAGLRNWATTSRSPIALKTNVSNADLADIMVLAGQPPAGYSGALSGTASLGGTLGNPQGDAAFTVGKGMAADEPFNAAQLRVTLRDRMITVPAASVDAPAGRVELTAEYSHSPENLTDGQLHAHMQTAGLDLARSPSVQKQRAGTEGTVRLNADLKARLSSKEPALTLTQVAGEVSARGLRVDAQNYGDVSATAQTNGQTVAYNLTSDFAGSNIHATGTTELRPDYPTRASATIENLPVERLLVLAKQGDIPARGLIGGRVEFNGTTKAPLGSVDLNVTRGAAFGETIDRVRLRASYLAQALDLPQLEIVSGPSHIEISGRYDHPAGDLQRGTARFKIANGHVDLSRVAAVQKYRPGLAGTAELSAEGSGTVQTGTPRLLLNSFNANVEAARLSAPGKDFGALRLTANTTGNRLTYALESNLAGSSIKGNGNAVLAGDYPLETNLTFQNVTWSKVADLLGRNAAGGPDFDAATDGQLSLRGPVMKPEQLSGTASISRISVNTIPRRPNDRPLTIANQGPVQLALDRGTLRIANAHLNGANTDLQATGTARIFGGGELNLAVNGNVDLSIVQNFDRDAYSSGRVTLAATVRGDLANPAINGQLALEKVTMSYASSPVGISNANGAVVFNGTSAQLRNMTADMGGGRLTLSGFATYAGITRFGLRANASNVRVRVQQGVSVVSDADLRLNGTMDASRVSGDVTLQRVTYAPQSDIGSMLTRSAPPVQSPTTPSPLLDSMKLDIRVRSAPGMLVESSLAESLQASANLTVNGTANQPGVLGRVTLSEGKLTFFGANYTINTGSVAFYNPLRIEPVLDISLQTEAKGVTVTLQVSGPVDNMQLSYTSDPPLQFQEIVTLLASGKAPTSDPTLLAKQPDQPQQSFQQMGESAILGQAVANPVASRLQRVFGVTALKIDPSFTTGSNVPTAQLSMQQRITSNLTFTYSSAINNPNSMLVRVEWAFNPQWSAVATRDQNGMFNVNFFYKRSFR